MFGVVTAQLSTLTDAEKHRYQALYCGLCRALKDRYGQASRSVLTYDLTFYIMLCNALHEPCEQTGAARCIAHPAKDMPFSRSVFTDHAADLAVALAYHKCLDDWNDDRAPAARIAQKMLAGAYRCACEMAPEDCAAIEESMERISRIERETNAAPDAAAREFGMLLGLLFARDQGIWADAMRAFGYRLGRFVYLMDAAVDYEQDKRSGSYNPLAQVGMTPEDMRELLSVSIGDATQVFEKLPLDQDLHLMRSILYGGVWQKFNEIYEKEHHD